MSITEGVAAHPASGGVVTGVHVDTSGTAASAKASPHRLHRIAEVRRQQGLSMRTIARHTGEEVRALRQEEDETADLRLSDLYRWQDALGVPVADLLVEPTSSLAPEVNQRAQLVKVMKTVAALLESAETSSVRRLAETLRGQLIEIMPELDGVGPWPAVGQRRSLDDYGRAAERNFSFPNRGDW